jgi:hypothetical protein
MVRYSALDGEKGGMVVEYIVELKNPVFFLGRRKCRMRRQMQQRKVRSIEAFQS